MVCIAINYYTIHIVVVLYNLEVVVGGGVYANEVYS